MADFAELDKILKKKAKSEDKKKKAAKLGDDEKALIAIADTDDTVAGSDVAIVVKHPTLVKASDIVGAAGADKVVSWQNRPKSDEEIALELRKKEAEEAAALAAAAAVKESSPTTAQPKFVARGQFGSTGKLDESKGPVVDQSKFISLEDLSKPAVPGASGASTSAATSSVASPTATHGETATSQPHSSGTSPVAAGPAKFQARTSGSSGAFPTATYKPPQHDATESRSPTARGEPAFVAPTKPTPTPDAEAAPTAQPEVSPQRSSTEAAPTATQKYQAKTSSAGASSPSTSTAPKFQASAVTTKYTPPQASPTTAAPTTSDQAATGSTSSARYQPPVSRPSVAPPARAKAASPESATPVTQPPSATTASAPAATETPEAGSAKFQARTGPGNAYRPGAFKTSNAR